MNGAIGTWIVSENRTTSRPLTTPVRSTWRPPARTPVDGSSGREPG
jgi:hypothetical protein